MSLPFSFSHLQQCPPPLCEARIDLPERVQHCQTQLYLPFFLRPSQGLLTSVQVDQVVHYVHQDVVGGVEELRVVEQHLLKVGDVAVGVVGDLNGEIGSC